MITTDRQLSGSVHPSAVIVGVPARNEASSVAACLRSIARAAHRARRPVVVVLAADCCTDGTAKIAETTDAAPARLVVVRGEWGSAGGARAAAISTGLALLADDTASAWIATTDADTIVAEDWLERQLDHARHGADAVAGIVELVDEPAVDIATVHAFERLYRLDGPTHPHVHGANLGVDAAWYRRTGGFRAVTCSEDHLLWQMLQRLGAHCLSTIDVRVATSARLHGRAAGGFADTLRAAVDPLAGEPA